jgi:ribosome-associated toxin RatA of RatAB toxin-antitoxin module
MTETSNEIVIAAPAKRIYDLAVATERWPDILPHYRYVRVLEERGSSRVVEMAAWRDFIPIRWVAEQSGDPERPIIRFHHIAGWTRGMDVEWRFEPHAEGTHVTIAHRLAFQFPFAADWLGRNVVGKFFIHDVAGKTLARMKVLAEAPA